MAIFWPKSSDIWYNLESKIQEYHWILALKFKLDDLPDFVKIQFFDKNMTFDTVWRAYIRWRSSCVTHFCNNNKKTFTQLCNFCRYLYVPGRTSGNSWNMYRRNTRSHFSQPPRKSTQTNCWIFWIRSENGSSTGSSVSIVSVSMATTSKIWTS